MKHLSWQNFRVYYCTLRGARWRSGKQLDPYWNGASSLPAAVAFFAPQRQAAQYLGRCDKSAG